MNLKALGSVALVIVVTFAVAAGLYFITPKAAPAPPKTDISLTETPDFNACNVIKTEDITNNDFITDISQPARVGIKAPNDTIADSCAFTLTTEKSDSNSFSVQVYPYTAVIDGQNKEAVEASWTKVATSNPQAYFGKATDGDEIVYTLRVIPGGKNVLFELRQPSSDAAIDEPGAKEFLVELAANADLSVIDLPLEP